MKTTLAAPKQSTPAPAALSRRVLQRTCACGGTPGPTGECAECRRKRLGVQRQASNPSLPSNPTAVPAIVHEVLRSSGRPLDAAARGFMEPRFGHNFSKVRVHTEALAAASAESVQAHAYTVGHDIVFGSGQYAPGTMPGNRLLAHELTHVLQQGSSAPAWQSQLKVSPAHDAAETEADRTAEQVLRADPAMQASPRPVTQVPSALHRKPKKPQKIGETRKVTLPTQTRGKEKVRTHVIRSLVPCPCRQLADARTGIFYNPDLDNVAIAYRYCRGRTSVDVYGQLQSNATAFLTGGSPPAGTARVGIDINLSGRKVGTRIVLEAIGTNDSATGIGGRGQIIFQGGKWRVHLDPQFLRRLQNVPGGDTPNDLEVTLGAEFGGVKLRVELKNLLSPTGRSGSGTLCVPTGIGFDVCAFLEAGGARGTTGGIGINIPIPSGGKVRKEKCYQCFCPPPVRKYTCLEDVLPREEEVTEKVPEERTSLFQYYFRLDKTSSSEDAGLRAQSKANLSALGTEVKAGGSVTQITGYASPEASERYNEDLTKRRAEKMRELVQTEVGSAVTLPTADAGGELLGSRPRPTPSSRLGDAITDTGFRSAEDLTVFLLGEEIPNKELAKQFISLFEKLTEPKDRLALFGLSESDPIAKQVLTSVNQFMRTKGRGHRPWERIFRLLRKGVARVNRIEMVEQTTTVKHAGSLKELTEDECKRHSAAAEKTGTFDPIDKSALKPTTSSADSNDDCLIAPQSSDKKKGCKYELPKAFRKKATAPSVAPRRIPGS